MPDWYYAFAARIAHDKLVVITCVAFGLVVAPLIALSLDHGQLYGVALMAASWWPVVLLMKFHPERRAKAGAPEDWFWALLLDFLALNVPFILYLAATKKT
jgi:hypothetical protein